MKTRTKPKRRLFLTKNFITMLVLLVVIIATISAWFTQHKEVTANNMSVKALSTEIDIAPCVKKWNDPNESWYDSTKEDFEVLTDGPGEFGESIIFDFSTDENYDGKFTKDCTGDGENMYVPDFNITNDFDSVRVNGGKDVNTGIAGRDAISQED